MFSRGILTKRFIGQPSYIIYLNWNKINVHLDHNLNSGCVCVKDELEPTRVVC